RGPPAKRHRELTRDRQAEPGAFAVVRPERAEDPLLLVGADPRPRVLDRDVDVLVLRAQVQADAASVRRPAESVREQVRDDLEDAVAGGDDHWLGGDVLR